MSEPREWPQVFAFDLPGMCDFVAFVVGRMLEHLGIDDATPEHYEVTSAAITEYINAQLAGIDRAADLEAFAASVKADLEALNTQPEHRPEFE